MKVYVCYSWIEYEGCSSPTAVYSEEAKAIEHCDAANTDADGYATHEYKELVLQ